MSVRFPGHDVELRARVNAVRLSPALRIVGEYLIEHAREVAVASSSQLAEQAGVSQASVSRFSQAVGFRDYGGLQHWVRDLVLRDTAGTAGAAAVSNRFQDLADSETAAVAALGEWFGDHALLQRAAGALSASNPLPVLGARLAQSFATHFAYLAGRIRPHVRLIISADSSAHDQLRLAAHDGATAALGFVVPRVERDVVATMTSAAELGLDLFVVSDPRHLSSRIDATLLPVMISTGALFDSHAAVTVMIAALIDAIGDQDRSASQARLEAIEGRNGRRPSGTGRRAGE
jgi:DNA-binding MurR/RpiR family transcriptional regulator